MRIEIRDEREGDVQSIAAVTHAAFAPMPFSDGTEAGIIEALRRAGALSVSLVATLDGEVVGHISFSPITIDGRAGPWYQLGPLSVRPDVQKAGVGGALIGEGLARLRALGAEACMVLGDPRYYGRFGFVSDPALSDRAAANPHFQRLLLSGGAPQGRVAYHPAFG